MKKFFSGSRKSYLGIFLLISGLCSIDLALNSYSSVHQLCFSMGDIVRTILLWILLLFSFVLLGGKYIRIPFMFLVVWMLTIDFLEIFMLYNFHHLLSGEVIFIFFISSWNEIKIFCEEYFTLALLLFIVMYLLLIVALIFSLLKSVKFRPTPKTILAGLIGVAIFIGYYYYRSFYIYTGWPIIAKSTLFTGVPYSLHDHWNKFNNMIKSSINPQLPTGIKIIPPAIRDTDKPIIGVIVIGESASRNYMNLYGYSRDTTPMLNKIKNELLIYNDLCGSEPITCLALHKLFSQATVAHPNNFQCTYWDVLKHAGFKIIYISSQEKWGTKAGDINDPRQLEQSILFKAVDKAIYSKDYDPQSYNTKFDKALLPIFIEELRKNAHHNTIICVHLLGSHFPQEKFCPSDFGKISENLVDAETQGLTPGMRKRRNYYDNSIAFTDEVLNELLVELKKIDATTFALYISDHGETPQSAVWRDNDDIDLWELPLIIWLSNKYQWAYPEFRKGARKNLNQPMQSEFLFWSLLALAQVTTDNFPETKNIFSEKYIPPKERFIQNGKVKYVPNKQR